MSDESKKRKAEVIDVTDDKSETKKPKIEPSKTLVWEDICRSKVDCQMLWRKEEYKLTRRDFDMDYFKASAREEETLITEVGDVEKNLDGVISLLLYHWGNKCGMLRDQFIRYSKSKKLEERQKIVKALKQEQYQPVLAWGSDVDDHALYVILDTTKVQFPDREIIVYMRIQGQSMEFQLKLHKLLIQLFTVADSIVETRLLS